MKIRNYLMKIRNYLMKIKSNYNIHYIIVLNEITIIAQSSQTLQLS